jgi:hypothetical protein
MSFVIDKVEVELPSALERSRRPETKRPLVVVFEMPENNSVIKEPHTTHLRDKNKNK